MENIIITYFVNPHRFWFKREEFHPDEEISIFRANLDRALRTQSFNAETWTPAVGETVAYFQRDSAVWDRAVVREIALNGNITLWIEDCGKLQKARKKEIRPMPKNVTLPSKKIVREGGLFELIPAKRKFNLNTMRIQMVDCGGVWAEDAIELMREAINIADSITFEIKSSPDKNTAFGNLTFRLPNGKSLTAVELLADYSQQSEKFLEVISRDVACKLRLAGEENSPATTPSINRCSVNEWVEKSIDVLDDNFDDSVSTFNPQHQTSRENFPKMKLPSPKPKSSQPPSAGRIESSWTPQPLPKPQGIDRGYDGDFSPNAAKSHEQPKQRITADDIFKGMSGSSNTDSANLCPSDQDIRKIYNANVEKARMMARERLNKSSNGAASTMPTNGLSESSRSHHNPQPAGMLQHAPSKKAKEKMEKAMRRAGMDPNSPGVDLRELGEAPVARTAKKRYQRVLVHCPLPVTMVEKITDAFFCPEVHEKLKQFRIDDVHRIQSHAWPHIFRGGSAVLVGNRNSGMTLAYLPMLYTRMKQDQEDGTLGLNVGARAIVICGSSRKVQKTSKTFDGFNDRHRTQLTVLVSSAPCETRDHVIELQNGFDVLFTTVPGFKRLLECAQQETVDVFQLEDLQYIVVDDYDTIVQHYGKQLKSILKTLMSRVDEHGKFKTQVVFTSTRWMPEFMSFLKRFDNPMLCISSGVEAALYGRAKFNLQILTRDEKVRAVREILSTQNYFHEPTMVICNTAEEVEHLADVLRKASVSVMAFTTTTIETHQMNRNAVILCTDACLLHINVRYIQNLIHFSLPEKWSMYDQRFVACFEYYEDQVTSGGEATKPPAIVQIFCDQDNDLQLPKLIDFMIKRFSRVAIGPEIVACAQASLERKEHRKLARGVPLCPAMMEFGECRIKRFDCVHRHNFSPADAPSPLLPTKGFIRMKIVNVLSPLHFQGHVQHSMPHRISPESEWRIEMQSDKFLVFQNDLNRHMMCEGNQLTPSSADVAENDIYVLPFDHTYLRVRVDSIVRERSKVMVSLTGVDVPKTVEKVSVQDLLVLPQEFRDFPHQLIDIRLFGLMPNDNEMQWDARSITKVKEWIKEANESNNLSFLGEIELTLNKTIYVKSLFCVEYFDTNHTNFVKFSLRNRILNEQIGMEWDRENINFLRNLAEAIGLEEKKETKEEEPPEEAVAPQPQIPSRWMSLAKEAFVNVQMLNFESPTEFYVQDLTRAPALKKLNEQISTFVEQGLENLRDLRVGNHCLVRMDETYIRAKIWQGTPDDDEYHLFLVDEGYFSIYKSEEIFEISEALIKDYPFFAIRCALLGVTERASKFSDEEGNDEMYEKYFRVPNDKFALNAYTVDEKVLKGGDNWRVKVHYVILLAAGEDVPVVNERVVEGNYCVRNDKWPTVEKFIRDVEEHPQILEDLSKKLEEERDWDEELAAEEEAAKKEGKVEKEEKSVMYNKLETEGTASGDSSGVAAALPLKPLLPAPAIEWRQTSQDIILYVTAVDMKDYKVELKQNYLTLGLVFEDKPQQGCVINFFGCIVVPNSGVRVRGNSIVIRLKKCISGKKFNWPTLMDPPEKVSWLREAIEVVKSDTEESDGSEKPLIQKGSPGESEGTPAEESSDISSFNSDRDIHFEDHFVPPKK